MQLLYDLKTKEKSVESSHYITDYNFNSAGQFYKKSTSFPKFPYYVYFFEISPHAIKIEIRNNKVGGGLNERMGQWPAAGLFYTSKDNPLFQSTKFTFPNDTSIGAGEGVDCTVAGLNYISTPFPAISTKEYPIMTEIPRDFFKLDTSKESLYLAVPSQLDPETAAKELEVVQEVYNTDGVYYFTEYPIAEAIYDGDPLARSRIKFGKVMCGDSPVGGLFIWNDGSLDSIEKSYNEVKCGLYDCKQVEAYYFQPNQFQTLELNIAFEEIFRRENVDAVFDSNSWAKAYRSAMSYVNRHYTLRGKFKMLVPVYKRPSNRDVFLWSQNTLVKPEDYYGTGYDSVLGMYAPNNLRYFNRHRQFPNLFDSFSMAEIYPDVESLETVSPEQAAEKMARALMWQPRGRRSVSVEGSGLKKLMGGAIEIADKVDRSDAVLEKKKKNFIHSMAYFDDSTQEGLCGDGYIFYDAPIHYDNPKIKDADESVKSDYCEQLRKLYTNPNVRSEDKPEGAISGCEALRNLLYKVFDALKKKYHTGVDFIFCDFEGMRNTANEIRIARRAPDIENDPPSEKLLESTRDQVWASILGSLKDRQGKETESYRKIYDKLLERGYAFEDNGKALMLNDVKSARHSEISEKPNSFRSSCGYNASATYAQRRNINIWDCVMLEYYAGLLDKYLVGPVREHFPNVVRSLHACNNQAGYINHHQNGSEFETYLGGNVNLPAGMRSNPSLYTLKLDAFEKDSMDNWKTYIPKVTPFARLIFDINNVRAATLSNSEEKVHPFIASQYSWNNFSGERGEGDKKDNYTPTEEQLKTVSYNSCFQREMLIHSWMCNPEITYAYMDYNYDARAQGKVLKGAGRDSLATFDPIAKQDYLKEVFSDLQKTINELNKILPTSLSRKISKRYPIYLKRRSLKKLRKPKVGSIIQETIPENSPFIMSGWQIGQFKVYRITLENYDSGAFKNALYVRRAKYGFAWQKLPRFSRPKRLDAFLATSGGKTVVFPHARVIKCESGPGRWVVMKGNLRPYVLSERDYYETHPSLDMQGANLPVFRSGNAVAVLDNTSVFGEIAHKQKWVANVKMGKTVDKNTVILGEALGDSAVNYQGNQEYEFTREIDLSSHFPVGADESVRPMTYLKVADDTCKISHVKAMIQGANVRLDIFRRSDGVNIGRVKNCRCTKSSEILMLKVSWLNATNQDVSYTLKYTYKGLNKQTISKGILARAGDEGFLVIPLYPVAGTKSIEAVILRRGRPRRTRSTTIG